MEQTEQNEIQEDVSLYKSLDALAHSDGGKILIDSLGKDVVNSVDNLTAKYKEASHIELISIIAKLQSDLSLLRVLTRAEKNKEQAQEELKKLLEE